MKNQWLITKIIVLIKYLMRSSKKNYHAQCAGMRLISLKYVTSSTFKKKKKMQQAHQC